MQTRKPTILALVRYYLPGHKSGGPVRTISNMVDQLGDEFDFRIVTSDRDSLDEVSYPGVALDTWNQVGKAKVYYLSPRNRSMLALARLCSDTPYDVLVLNSFFDPVFTQWPLLARRLGLLPAKPIVIAPRGEFSSGAMALNRWKKASYKWLASTLGLYSDLTWQASNEYEVADIRYAMDRTAQQIVVASNLASLPNEKELEYNSLVRKPQDTLIVFLSRITPKKNLDFALRVMAKVKIPVRFNIYGPIGSEPYWRRCEGLIAELPSNVLVQYAGVLAHLEVSTVLGSHDLLFLPTRGENYGHVIMESLSAGTPVLIADTTPWRDLEQAGVGWDLPLDSEQRFADKIHHIAQMSDEAYRLLREQVRSFALQRAADPGILAANRKLFMEASRRVLTN